MKLKVQVDDDGAAYVAAIDPESGEHRKAATVGKGQTLDIDIPGATSVEDVDFSDVVETGAEQPEPTPAEPSPGAGPDSPGGPTDPESPGPNASDGEQGGEQPPAGGDQGNGAPDGGTPAEQPSTSEASEKPLYLIEGDEVPGEFALSGLETPSGESLFHFAGDAAGETGKGNGDKISIYADADDNEKPVQAATPPEPTS